MTESSPYSLGVKILAYIIMIATLGLTIQEAIRVPPKFHPDSLKAKVTRVTTILWAIIFFCIGADVVVTMFDAFFVNRAILVKILTRVFLFLLVTIVITDGIVSVIPNSDKAKE